MNKRRKLEHKKTNFCATFILPMVGVNHKNLPNNFINAYIDLDYKVYIVFDKTEDYNIDFHNYNEHLKSTNKHIIDYLDLEDEIVVSFKIPDKYNTNFNLFIQGKYSNFDESYKTVITNYFGRKIIKDNYTVTEYNVIYPQEYKRLQIAERLYDKNSIKEGLKLIKEVLDPPNLDKEIYKTIEQLENKQEDNKYDAAL